MLFPSNTTQIPKEITEADVIGFFAAHGRRIRAMYPKSCAALMMDYTIYPSGETRAQWRTYCADLPEGKAHSESVESLDAAMAHLFSAEQKTNRARQLRAQAEELLAEAEAIED